MPSFPLSFSLSPMPTGLALDANGFGQQLVQNLSATITGNFLIGQIGGTQPTTNIGPWLNGNQWWFWDPTSNQYLVQTFSAESAGVIKLYTGASPPSGYLFCDGSLYLRSTYTGLFAVIGGTYNNGDGVSTFGVPDLRGRVPVGLGTGAGLTARSLGQSFGEEKHLLITGELASHGHGITDPSHNHSINDPTHNHGVSDPSHNHGVSDPSHNHSLNDPSHNHSINNPAHSHTDSGHTHTYTAPTFGVSGDQVQPQAGGVLIGEATFNTGSAAAAITSTTTSISANGAFTGMSANGAFTGITNNAAATGISNIAAATGVSNNAAATGITVNNAGGGLSHNNIQPGLVFAYIIKT